MNNQNLVFVPQSGVAEELVVAIKNSNLTLFGLGYVYSHEGESWDLSSTQICGGEWWMNEQETEEDFARRVLAIDPEKEYGVQYWVIGFEDPTNASEEPTLLFKVWEGKY